MWIRRLLHLRAAAGSSKIRAAPTSSSRPRLPGPRPWPRPLPPSHRPRRLLTSPIVLPASKAKEYPTTRMDRHQSSLAKLGMGFLAFNSALAVYNSWGDAGSVAFVLAADAALVLLFLCLRRLELDRAAGRGGRSSMKAAVWALTTLLTAMFASKVAPLMPAAVAADAWAMTVAAAAEGFWELSQYLNSP